MYGCQCIDVYGSQRHENDLNQSPKIKWLLLNDMMVGSTCQQAFTCLRRCTRRPRVETRATENPVRPCVLAGCSAAPVEGWPAPSLSGSWGPRESRSASTRASMACSMSRLDRFPPRESTDEPSSGPEVSGSPRVLRRLQGAVLDRPGRPHKDMKI